MNAFLFFGENRYLLNKEVRRSVEEFKKDEGEMNLAILEGSDTSEEEIINACETPPFLGNARLVIVRDWDFKKNSEKLANFVEKIPDHAKLILLGKGVDARKKLFKTFKKNGEVNEFTNLKPAEFKKWLTDEIRRENLDFAKDALDLLATYTLGDCESATNEIAKLSTYTDGKKIEVEDVKLLTHPNLHTSVFNLTDAIGERRIESALANLHDIVNRGENLMQIFFMVVRQFRILLNLCALKSQRLSPLQVAQQLKLHPFVVQNSLRQVRNFSEQELLEAHRKLLEIDVGVKSGKLNYSSANPTEFALALEKFIVSFA